ncbi:Protein of unknown function [Pyronema omphalodes CBS 100304]|uniref:Uncharacterized protein n=1 Tax=Pyronema omphalodes (strain CBS 100304) TaxID=1076935 RepID=U4L863_PYROM|nr:Protein of unknown function [Pyronema omphalodes CBS 100304]
MSYSDSYQKRKRSFEEDHRVKRCKDIERAHPRESTPSSTASGTIRWDRPHRYFESLTLANSSLGSTRPKLWRTG